MQRITVTVTNEQARRLRSEARRRGTSMSEIVRGRLEPAEENLTPRVIPWEGIADIDDGIHAAELDQFLAEHWPRDIDSRS